MQHGEPGGLAPPFHGRARRPRRAGNLCSIFVDGPITPNTTNAIVKIPTASPQTLRPIASLISKSGKAQRKLAPGTWQHAMLQDNLEALHMASALLRGEPGAAGSFTQAGLQKALKAFAAMIGRTAKSQEKFPPGTSQHTLQRNRLAALRTAEARIKAELAAH